MIDFLNRKKQEMGYSKKITELSVYCWDMGLTASGTGEWIKNGKKKISLSTVYRHRPSYTAIEFMKELMRE